MQFTGSGIKLNKMKVSLVKEAFDEQSKGQTHTWLDDFLHDYANHSRSKLFCIFRSRGHERRRPNINLSWTCCTACHPFESAEFIPFQEKSKHQCSKADSLHPPWAQHCLLRDTFRYNDSIYFGQQFRRHLHAGIHHRHLSCYCIQGDFLVQE